MKIHIINIEIGAEYEGKIYDFWIFGLLKNGMYIKIFDLNAFDLRKHLNQDIEVLLLASYITYLNISDLTYENQIFGKFIDERYSFENLKKYTHIYPVAIEKFLCFETDNGIFIVNPNELNKTKLTKDEVFSFKVSRFDLIAYSISTAAK